SARRRRDAATASHGSTPERLGQDARRVERALSTKETRDADAAANELVDRHGANELLEERARDRGDRATLDRFVERPEEAGPDGGVELSPAQMLAAAGRAAADREHERLARDAELARRVVEPGEDHLLDSAAEP